MVADPRGVIPLTAFAPSRSLRKACARFEIRVDSAFGEVIEACADPARPHGWISAGINSAYRRLHELGWVHSVEAWSLDTGELAGGLYGVCIG
ncbi:MAG: leucyl/phenylalanyl-tRNA--protein transferase, partial [Acidimicrobiia bacterium]